jgi:hypothetical protein
LGVQKATKQFSLSENQREELRLITIGVYECRGDISMHRIGTCLALQVLLIGFTIVLVAFSVLSADEGGEIGTNNRNAWDKESYEPLKIIGGVVLDADLQDEEM